MAKNKFIGLRTLKTVFAVFITLIIDKFSSTLDLFIMASTAIISLKPTKEKTILIGIERILGTIIGGILSLTLLYAKDYIPYYEEFTYILIIPLVILILIIICNFIKQSDSIGVASIVFFRVITGISTSNASELMYVITRVISSMIGVIISLVLNSISKFSYVETNNSNNN